MSYLCLALLFYPSFTLYPNHAPRRVVLVEPRYQQGFLLPLYDAIAFLVNENIRVYEVNLLFPTSGNSYWEQLYRNPSPGFGYCFHSLGNSEVYGHAHALYALFNIPIIRRSDRLSINYQGTAGFAWIQKTFHPFNNHLNRAISAHINVYLRLGVDARYQLNDRLGLVMEAGGGHFSNGKFRTPNYGLNSATLSVGASYRIENRNADYQITNETFPGHNRFRHLLLYSVGSKVYDDLMGHRFFITSLTYTAERLLNHKRALGIGVDLFYDKSIREALSKHDPDMEVPFSSLIRAGLHASHSLQYKRVLFTMNIGHYLYSTHTDLTLFYSRLAIRYFLTDRLMFSMAIKAHMAKADFAEWGVGWKF